MYYYREPSSGRMTAMYGSQASQPLGWLGFGSYNLFLNMQSWLRLSNTSDEQITAQFGVSGGDDKMREVTLPPHATIVQALHDFSSFGTQANTYGTVLMRSEPDDRLLGEIVRVRHLSDEVMDFAAPTLVR